MNDGLLAVLKAERRVGERASLYTFTLIYRINDLARAYLAFAVPCYMQSEDQ